MTRENNTYTFLVWQDLYIRKESGQLQDEREEQVLEELEDMLAIEGINPHQEMENLYFLPE